MSSLYCAGSLGLSGCLHLELLLAFSAPTNHDICMVASRQCIFCSETR